jgi:hypothetical protein
MFTGEPTLAAGNVDEVDRQAHLQLTVFPQLSSAMTFQGPQNTVTETHLVVAVDEFRPNRRSDPPRPNTTKGQRT